MNREEALKLVSEYVKNRNSIKHMIAAGAVMGALAKRFDQDEKEWELVGLLHDIDMEITEKMEDHGREGSLILEREGFSGKIRDAVLAHNPATGKKPETLMEKAIYCTDPLTGLIVASVLVLPNKKIADLNTASVVKRFKEKSFAKGANREVISSCSEIGLSLEEFIQIALVAMKGVSAELEL